MLSERQLEALLALFEERMQNITAEYLTAMGKHLKDIGSLKASDIHRLTEMKRVGLNAKRIKREIAKAANMSVADLDRVFRAVAESDARFAEQWFAADYTPAVKGLPKLSKPIERLLKAQLRITAQAFKNLSQTTIETQRYRKAVDEAISAVQSGVTDYNSAIRRAMKTAAEDGLRVKYPNSGMTRRLDSAVRQNVLDGVRAINNDVLRQLGNEYGADGIEISAHALCATDHLPYQGLQFSNRDFEELQNSLGRPFGAWNCKHTMFPIILGVSVPVHDADELRMYRENSAAEIEIDGRTMSRYEWSQEQRRIETAVRAQKDIAIAAKASGDDVARREAQSKINALQDHYEKVSRTAGLDMQRDRMRVAGFRAVKASKPTQNTLKQEQNNQHALAKSRKKDIIKDEQEIALNTRKENALSEIANFESQIAKLDSDLQANEKALEVTTDFSEMVRLSEDADRIAEERSKISSLLNEAKYQLNGIQRDIEWYPYEKQFSGLKKVGDVEQAIVKAGWFDGKVSLQGCSVDTARSIASSFNRVFSEYPEMIGKVKGVSTQAFDVGVWAGFDPMDRKIKISYAKYSNDVETLKQQYANSVKRGYFAEGTDYRSIFVHEMGHAIDFYVGEKKGVERISYAMQHEYLTKEAGFKSADSQKAQEYIVRNVSKYANTNPKELLAECFSEYITSVHPREMAKWYGERIDKEIKEAFGK